MVEYNFDIEAKGQGHTEVYRNLCTHYPIELPSCGKYDTIVK